MSDSSSEDENLNKIRAAVDSNFLKDCMFHKEENNKETAVTTVNLPPSLRESINEDDQHSDLHVTPEFQKYVAKHLSQILEKQLKEVRPKSSNMSNISSKNTGIRLLHNSTSYILSEDEIVKVNVQKKKEVLSSDSEEEKLKVSLAVVSPEWVLNKEGIKGWSKNTKGEVIEGVFEKKRKKKKKKTSDKVINI